MASNGSNHNDQIFKEEESEDNINLENNENPWNIQSIYELQYFNCPACNYKNQFKQKFLLHANEFHPECIPYLSTIPDDSLNDVICPWKSTQFDLLEIPAFIRDDADACICTSLALLVRGVDGPWGRVCGRLPSAALGDSVVIIPSRLPITSNPPTHPSICNQVVGQERPPCSIWSQPIRMLWITCKKLSLSSLQETGPTEWCRSNEM